MTSVDHCRNVFVTACAKQRITVVAEHVDHAHSVSVKLVRGSASMTVRIYRTRDVRRPVSLSIDSGLVYKIMAGFPVNVDASVARLAEWMDKACAVASD
jgi:hypothetical protein